MGRTFATLSINRLAGLTLMVILMLGCYQTTENTENTEVLVIDLSKTLPTNPYQKEYEKMLYPTVRIKTGFSTGSGVAIDDYIFTAAHVVGNQSEVTVEIFYPNLSEFSASVVITDTAKDMALIRPSKKLPYSATLANRDYKPYLFAPIYTVGCSLGLKPRPSSGIISVIEDTYWGISAPVLPGNSGGPVYDAKTYEVIGISVWINTCQGQLVPTMAGIVPIQTIYEFLSHHKDTKDTKNSP